MWKVLNTYKTHKRRKPFWSTTLISRLINHLWHISFDILHLLHESQRNISWKHGFILKSPNCVLKLYIKFEINVIPLLLLWDKSRKKQMMWTHLRLNQWLWWDWVQATVASVQQQNSTWKFSNIIEYVWKLSEIHSKASNKSVVFQKKNLGIQGMYVMWVSLFNQLDLLIS